MTVFHRNEKRGELPASLRGGVIAIGNFDGVHRGHQAVLARALEIAADQRIPSLVLTFEPHPRSVFRPDQPVFRLTPAPIKARLLEALGFNAVLEYPFDRDFAARSPEEFIHSIILDWIGARHVVTGFDFHFGKNREGGPAYLLAAGGRYGFGCHLLDAFRDEGAHVVSSSRIRDLISEGDVTQAAGLLGYRYTVQAEVIHGKKLGRTLGFPTANMALPTEVRLKPGIYAVRFRLADGTLHDGVASFGYRPTVDSDGAALLETVLFDYSGDLYGQTCSVSFFGFLRPELKFEGLDPLVAQMNMDAAEARALLSSVQPLGPLDRVIAFPEN
ncbi:bifunctional riboflavin kinase/FAD synthetase [Rhizobium sp.]